MRLNGNSADELAAQLMISRQAIKEAELRGLISFQKHRGAACWRFGDSRNGSIRRIDGEPFCITGELAKAEAETRGGAWHQLIGLDDVVKNARGDILFTPEGSKDALAALHMADAEDRLKDVGLVAALGSAVKLVPDDIEKLRGRRIRIFPDVDAAGQNAAARIGQSMAAVAAETQILDLRGLCRDDDAPVTDLFDVTRIAYDDFEANRDLWSITDLDSKGERVRLLTKKDEFFPSLPLLPHVSPESHGFPVYPVSNRRELEKELKELALRNACAECDTAREKRFKLARDLIAAERRICQKLSLHELTRTFDKWYEASAKHRDPKKSRDNCLAAFLAELGKVRVPTGDGEALKKALSRVLFLPVSELPELPIPNAPESWRRVAALHRELARQSASGTYFLSCRDAAKAHPSLNKDSANNIQRVLAQPQVGVTLLLRVGEMRPGGDASEYRYLLSI